MSSTEIATDKRKRDINLSQINWVAAITFICSIFIFFFTAQYGSYAILTALLFVPTGVGSLIWLIVYPMQKKIKTHTEIIHERIAIVVIAASSVLYAVTSSPW